jgi:amidase
MKLWQHGARAVVGLLADGKVSPLDCAEALLARIKDTQGTVNAIAALDIDRAMGRARAASTLRKRRRGALHGLPVLIKDMTDVAGLATTLGNPGRVGTPAPRSDICVERLEAAGGIVLAKSNVPFMGLGHDTANPLYGVTRNPWRLTHSTGGSSGGAAAALACGAAWLAHGTDLGGSIRSPAGHCGVVGLRPTPGRVAHGGIDTRRDPLEDQNLDGPMARDVADCALFLDAMAGEHPEDPLSMPAARGGYLGASLAPVLPGRVALSADLGVAPTDPAVRDVLDALARTLGGEGVTIEESIPSFVGVADAAYDLRLAWTRRRTSPADFEAQRPHLPEIAQRTWLDGQALTVERLLAAQMRQQKLIDDMRRLFRVVDCLLIPANPRPPQPLGSRHAAAAPNWAHDAVLSYAITLSWCPSISLPMGLTADDLPVGVQIVGPPRSERRLFRYAAAIEALVGVARHLPIAPRGASSSPPIPSSASLESVP